MFILEGLEGRKMKKLVFAVMFLFLFMKPAYANEVSISFVRLNGIYYNQVINGVLNSNHVTSFHLGGRIAYCIEPGAEIKTNTYTETDWSSISLSEEIRDYIEKVGYYGYDYPGHQTDRYYIAAQELIWKAVRPDIEVSWTTGVNKSGSVIDVSAEKKEIESLVRSRSLIPSFAFNDISGFLGDEIILTDENNVLSDYDISDSKYHEIIHEGNTLKIRLNQEKVDDEEIILTRKNYDNMPLVVYYRRGSQSLAALRISNEKELSFKISNKEKPIEEEIVEVPDTGIGFNFFGSISMILSGAFMVIYAIKIS